MDRLGTRIGIDIGALESCTDRSNIIESDLFSFIVYE